MRRHLLAGVSLLALVVGASSAEAAPFTFSYTGKAVDFIVPDTGIYRIIAYGAQGGGTSGGGTVFYSGGKGAEIGADFSLTEGEKLKIIVGGAGGIGGSSNNAQSYGGGGGGGGSFVILDKQTIPLVVAGGGGGASAYSFRNGHNGYDASIDISGTDGGGVYGHRGFGGSNGRGGSGGGYGGGGGGGGIVNGGSDGTLASGGVGGGGYPGLKGGTGNYEGGNGGFGGGGGGGGGRICSICSPGYGGGGGGGGYSGGGGGEGDSVLPTSFGYGGGGGGSSIFQSLSINQIRIAGVQTGDGQVVITELTDTTPVPEPASLGLLATGLAGLAAMRRRRPKP